METPPPPPQMPERATAEKGVCHVFLKHGSCRKGAKCPYKHEDNAPRRPNLVKRLLEREVNTENSKILQTFRYLVETDFLDDEESVAKKRKVEVQDVAPTKTDQEILAELVAPTKTDQEIL